ncbi:phage holin family protein [Pseudomonas alvandae]|jgi:xanthine/uracil permease|uniref:Phage holin family protein n=1 Tax=Pseudomonas canavaninivorans TaxID=2842348 RepID=A0ABX8QK48_PSECO|nr:MULTISPECIES: phage holin family protein [Pseudomonas]MBJ2350007.1 phage holin family protein [Pseudomonas canavaninivorans]QXI55434.1 phage holin family protein [Pseudomonas alvandae]UVM74560.1 phage holin family protein [Pseudomonas canavaninivorans]
MNRPDPDIQRSTGTSAPENDASVVGLLRQLTHEVPSLFTKELALAKAEFQASLNTLKAGIAGVAGGAMVLMAGFIILLMAVVYGLSTMMAPWLAALIVGVVVMIIGFVMVQSGKKQFEPSHFKPDRTLDALNKDQEALRRKAS